MDITDHIRANVKQLFGNQFWEARFVYKVDVGPKAEKVDRRVLVLSKFRLFFISGIKSTSKLHVETSYPLLSLTEITLPNTGSSELTICLDGRRLFIRFVEESVNAHDFVLQLLSAFKHYYEHCDIHRFIDLSPSSLYATYTTLPSARPSLPCTGFRRTYASLCDFYKQTFRDEIVWDIEKIYSLHNNTLLRLDDFGHLQSKDLIPLIATLQFNGWFKGIVSEALKLTSDVIDTVLLVLRKSHRIEQLTLKNCGLKSDFLLLLGQAFSSNPTLPLKYLDLSGNSFEENKYVHTFAVTLQHLLPTLRHLMLDECTLSTKAANYICDKLCNKEAPISANDKFSGIVTLSLAQNQFKDEIQELNTLLLSCCALNELNLSNTGCSLDKLWVGLKSCKDTLQRLKLNGCAFVSRKTAKDLGLLTCVKDFFSSARQLKFIDFSDCILPAEVLKYILLGLVCNQTTDDVTLHLNRSFNDRSCISHLETCAPELSIVAELFLRDCALEQESITLIPALSMMKNLRKLDLGGNNFVVSSKKQHTSKNLRHVLIELVKLISDENAPLQDLDLSDCHIGVGMCVFLNALGVAPSLRRLDVSGNDMTNFGARLLAKALQVNSCLETILVDRNQFTNEGFLEIAQALKFNSSLLNIPHPMHDVAESLKVAKEKTESVIIEIEQALQRNNKNLSLKDCAIEASSWIYETHSKLLLGNVEEELNQTASKTNRLLGEYNLDQNSVDVILAKKLIQDAETAKQMLDHLISLCDPGECITTVMDEVGKNMAEKLDQNFNANINDMLEYCSSSSLNLCHKQDFLQTLKQVSSQRKVELNVETSLKDFGRILRQRYGSVNFNMATAVTEKICHEIVKALNSVNSALGKAKKNSLTSLGSEKTNGASSSTATTPVGKKKFKIFAKRPISVVDDHSLHHLSDLMDDHSNEDLRERASFDHSADNLDSNSIEFINRDEFNASTDDSNNMAITPTTATAAPLALTHVQKGRAKPPAKRKAPTANNNKPAPKSDESMEKFFHVGSPEDSSKHRVTFIEPTKTEEKIAFLPPIDIVTTNEKRVSRVPVFLPGVLNELGQKVNAPLASPRHDNITIIKNGHSPNQGGEKSIITTETVYLEIKSPIVEHSKDELESSLQPTIKYNCKPQQSNHLDLPKKTPLQRIRETDPDQFNLSELLSIVDESFAFQDSPEFASLKPILVEKEFTTSTPNKPDLAGGDLVFTDAKCQDYVKISEKRTKDDSDELKPIVTPLLISDNHSLITNGRQSIILTPALSPRLQQNFTINDSIEANHVVKYQEKLSPREKDQNGDSNHHNQNHSINVMEKLKETNKPDRPPLPLRPPPPRPANRISEVLKDKDESITPVLRREKSETPTPADQRKSVFEMRRVFEASKKAQNSNTVATPLLSEKGPVPPPRHRLISNNNNLTKTE